VLLGEYFTWYQVPYSYYLVPGSLCCWGPTMKSLDSATRMNKQTPLPSLLHDELDSTSIPQHEFLMTTEVGNDFDVRSSVRPNSEIASNNRADFSSSSSLRGGHRHHELPPPSIYVSHGCLLIPVFFAAWLYYTKSCFRRVRGFLRSSPEPKEDAEKFVDKFSRFGDACVQWYVHWRTTIEWLVSLFLF
jgi:hypothetical protein